MTDLKLSIQGVQRAQYAALQVVRAVKPEGALGRAVKFLATGTHMRLVTLTHVDTGTLRASELIRMDNLLHYTVYNNPAARNPRSRAYAASYASIEEARGGSHAAWQQTYEYAAASLAPRALAMVIGELP